MVEKKIAIGAYNTLFPCVEQVGGVINYAQEQVAAGENAAKELLKAVGDKAGKVGIIVSQFTAPGSEQRRKGFIDGLKGSKLTLVSEGVEAKGFCAARPSTPPRTSFRRRPTLSAYIAPPAVPSAPRRPSRRPASKRPSRSSVTTSPLRTSRQFATAACTA